MDWHMSLADILREAIIKKTELIYNKVMVSTI